MSFIKRLMEIKEEQLLYEKRQDAYAYRMDATLTEILKVMKGGVKDGKRIRTSNRKASRISKKARN